MKRSEDRILTTHTGALHRPKELQGLALQQHTGELEDEAADEQTRTKAVAEGAEIASKELWK